VVGSNKYHRKIEREKLANEVKIATSLEFFSILFSLPVVSSMKIAPINGINIIEERIGKYI